MAFFYEERGEGPVVVLLHGYCETHWIWHSLSERLKRNHRVILIDLPGFGHSTLDRTNFTFTDIAQDIHRLLKEINVDNHVLIGHSMGGYISLAYASLFPDFLNGLGLFHSTVFEDSSEKKENRSKLVEFVENNGVKPFIKTFIPSLFSPKNVERLGNVIDQLRMMADEIMAESVTSYARAMRDRESSVSIMASFDKPVMFIVGEDDPSVPLAKSMEQVTLPQQCHFLRLPGTGHMGMFEQPERTELFVERFLKVCE
jgi:pimeloyl-ACP methyl ester carboxylesterase